MKGGKPGEFPKFDSSVIPGGALNYYDPFGWHKNRSEADKANGLVKEINNGRLAMLGILAFLSEGKAEGAVPALKGIIPAYAGEPMAPFAESIFPSL
jgi:Chlorophyll A-B binding protein